MSATLFRSVHILDLGLPGGLTEPTDVLVEDGRIAAIGMPTPAAVDTTLIDGSGHLLMPGLINAHFHSSVNHMKGRLPGLPLEVFMLYESPALPGLLPSPREAYLRTILGAIEMLRGGVTAVQDDAFFVPYPTPELIDAVMQAYADIGIRATVALDQPELAEIDKLPFLAEFAPPELLPVLSRAVIPGRRELLALYDHLIDRWHGHDSGRLRAAVSCSAPQRVSPEYFAALDGISRQYSLPLFAHMLETKLQRVLGEERFGGRSLIRYTADLGLLSERMNVIHAIWVDDADLDLLAGSGATVAHNPGSNLRLGSGVMPFRRMRERGIPIALGTDEAIADDAVNLWWAMKLAGSLHNLSDPDYERWPQAREVLACATTGGAHAMGLSCDLGSVTTGRFADLTLVDLGALPFVPLNDLPRQLVHCESGSSVRLTMVAGRIVYRGGRVTTVEETAILTEARELFALRAPALAEAAAAMAPFLPAYRAAYAKAAARDVGMNRWLGDAEREARQ